MDELDLGATIKGFIPGQKVFRRYTLQRLLGRGGMGVVWLARDDKLERDVALKFLPETVATDERALDDLKRETRRSLELTHPHIVRIYDFVDDARTAAIAMEYVDGRTLSKLALEMPDRVFPASQLQPWVEQLCAALDYAHGQARVVHRDLKPANLMVDTAGRLKIADFGISATLSDSTTRASKTTGTSGTPVYMSPQQMMGEKPAVTDDVYGLGATLYDLFTGKPPFYSGNILLQVQNKVPPTLTERRSELGVMGASIPPEWEATIAACLAKEAKDRPQSASEVLGRLKGVDGHKKAQKAAKTEPVVEPNLQAGREQVKAIRASLADAREGERARSSRAPTKIALAAAVVLLAAAGWYFGLHVPEQKRLAEIARLEAQLRNAQEKAAAETALLAPARGGLVIRTNPPGAEVRVGAVALERSPLTLKDQKLGKYPVRIRLDGYEEWTGEVEVKENDFTDLDIALVRSTGHAWRVPDLNLTLQPIAPGTFQMGSASSDQNDERPVTRVTLTRPFWLGKTEVTQGQWAAVMENNPSGFKGENLPVEQVSYDDALNFCRKLTERERAAGRLPDGYVYTLPTEAQWEYACRAGTTGQYAETLDVLGWYDKNSGGSTKPVGTKQANAWGLHDMHGNVWEWCLDWKGDYPGGSVTDPTGPTSGSFRVYRGGSWRNGAAFCRSAYRSWFGPDGRYHFLGFRLALSSVR